MCGIAGVLGLPGVEGALIAERMAARLDHRGPDDRSAWAGARIALAHRRLSILDLSEQGRQPMWDDRGRVGIVYNGEVYNFRQLATQLQAEAPGLQFRSRSDTEVILKAYGRWGRDSVRHLRGMFAFAIWDEDRQELFLARDRLGIKPLYYHAAPSCFMFSSEVRALLASGLVPPRLDPVAVWEYLAYQSVPAPRTLIEGVRSVAPGSWIVVDAAGRLTEGCYWDLLANASDEASSAAPGESRRRVRTLLRESVDLHMVSDVPVGVFLSGGIDSSAVVALMREAGHLPYTFTVVFTERDYDERRHARAIARRFRTDHTEILLRERDLLDQLPDALAAMDQVSGDAVNTYLISRAVRADGLKVALSGLGGDEFFGGYPSFTRLTRAARPLRGWASLPVGLRRFVARAARAAGRSSIAADKIASLLEGDSSLPAALVLGRQVLSAAQRRRLLSAGWLKRAESAADPYLVTLAEAYRRVPRAGLFARISYGEARTYLHDVLLRDTDQMGMAHGLEVRVPLLDHQLAEYVMGLPDAVKRPHGLPKRLLVESLSELLPEAIVRRPKQGFALPFDPWMRGELRSFCEVRLGPKRLGARGIFDPDRLRQFWQAFLDGRQDVSWSRLWILVALEEWIERNGVTAEA